MNRHELIFASTCLFRKHQIHVLELLKFYFLNSRCTMIS
ncbi:hypothetical protein CKA32_000872 [Geitlerinema sp. FC II]|nr:hypothetical protein CKA32_000872 [Geitlerinema sp. FC II]